MAKLLQLLIWLAKQKITLSDSKKWGKLNNHLVSSGYSLCFSGLYY